MNEQIEKILKFAEITITKKEQIVNFDDVKNQVSVLLMNEVFGKTINEGMKISLLKVISAILFDSDVKVNFSKIEHEWSTFYSIYTDNSKILFDEGKNFVQVTDAVTNKEQGNVIIYKCSKDIMTITNSTSREIETIIYDEIGLQKNKVVRGISIPSSVPYEERITRDHKDITTIFVSETLDNGEPFSAEVKKVAKIYELDTGANYVFHGNENDIESIISEVKKNVENEIEYKYFPDLKNKILNKLSLEYGIESGSNKVL